MSTPVETLAIMLQRAKTHMETTGISAGFDVTYHDLSSVLFVFEDLAKVDAPALRDAEDAAISGGVKRWYIETEDGHRHGPYADYDDCCSDADRLQGRIIEDIVSDDDVTAWECPECGDGAETDRA
jgi:hypothetical protein